MPSVPRISHRTHLIAFCMDRTYLSSNVFFFFFFSLRITMRALDDARATRAEISQLAGLEAKETHKVIVNYIIHVQTEEEEIASLA